MDWKLRREAEKEPDPDLELTARLAGEVAGVVDKVTAPVPLGVRIIALAGLLGICAARAGADLDTVFDVVREFHAQEQARTCTRGH